MTKVSDYIIYNICHIVLLTGCDSDKSEFVTNLHTVLLVLSTGPTNNVTKVREVANVSSVYSECRPVHVYDASHKFTGHSTPTSLKYMIRYT